MKKGELEIPILNDEYKVIVCWGDSAFIKRVLERRGHVYNALGLENRRGTCFFTEGYHPVICLPKFPTTATEIGTLAHESVHAIGYIFRMIGQNAAEEVYAHSVGAIVRKTLSRQS